MVGLAFWRVRVLHSINRFDHDAVLTCRQWYRLPCRGVSNGIISKLWRNGWQYLFGRSIPGVTTFIGSNRKLPFENVIACLQWKAEGSRVIDFTDSLDRDVRCFHPLAVSELAEVSHKKVAFP